MRRSNKFSNPFYVLLVIAGITFALTAFAYGILATRSNAGFRAPAQTSTISPEHALMKWMREYGNAALLTELAVLALCTVGAIGTDEYWQRRARAEKRSANINTASDAKLF